MKTHIEDLVVEIGAWHSAGVLDIAALVAGQQVVKGKVDFLVFV